jgi:hypothetical protein
MTPYDDARLDETLRDFLRVRAHDIESMRDASTTTSAIATRLGSGRDATTVRYGRLLLVGIVLALVAAAAAILVGSRQANPLNARPDRFAGFPYRLDLAPSWVGGGPDTYGEDVAWFRANHPGQGHDLPTHHPYAPAGGRSFVAYDTDEPRLEIHIAGPFRVPSDTSVETEIHVWEHAFDAVGIVDAVTLPAGEARRARTGIGSNGLRQSVYLIVVGRDFYDLTFSFDPATDPTDEVAAIASTFIAVEPSAPHQ